MNKIQEEAQKFKDQTGIELPTLLIDLYEKKGNGGFGPQYGMIGIIDGHKTDLGDSLLTLYQSFCQNDPDDPGWNWPKNLIPFIHIGCAIYYCIDCDDPNFKIVEFDPNGHGPGVEWGTAYKAICTSFSEWVENNIEV